MANIGYFYQTTGIYGFKFSPESHCEGLFMDIKWRAYCKGGREHNQKSLTYIPPSPPPQKKKKKQKNTYSNGFQGSF